MILVLNCSSIRFFILYRTHRALLPVYIIPLLERSQKTSLLKTLVISFLGQAIYVQFVDVDFEGCRAASQPRNSQGHFLCSTPYRARPSQTELLRQRAAVPHKHLRDQSLCWRPSLLAVITLKRLDCVEPATFFSNV